MDNPSALAVAATEHALPIVAGCVTFGTTLAFSTLAQKVLGISTAKRFVPTVVGMATVCFASVASQRATIVAKDWMHNPESRNAKRLLQIFTAPSACKEYWEIGGIHVPKHEARVCAVGLLAFHLLGGRFWAIAPSSYTTPGSFARQSLPATKDYISPNQRPLLYAIGKRYGCHTCGTRVPPFIGDHMPPLSIAEKWNTSWYRKLGIWPKIRYRFYPHCAKCSQNQSTVLRIAGKKVQSALHATAKASFLHAAGSGRQSFFHGNRPRLNHLAGGILGGLTVVGTTDREVAMGNRARFQRLERRVSQVLNRAKGFFL